MVFARYVGDLFSHGIYEVIVRKYRITSFFELYAFIILFSFLRNNFYFAMYSLAWNLNATHILNMKIIIYMT